jgi:hypothetical protein
MNNIHNKIQGHYFILCLYRTHMALYRRTNYLKHYLKIDVGIYFYHVYFQEMAELAENY